jgi:hypothetical protein
VIESTAVALLLTALIAQTPPPPPPPRLPPQIGQPRDIVRRPEPTGTGVIRGRVVAGDTGSPIRRASVNLQPVPPPPPPPGTQGTSTTISTVAGGGTVFVGPSTMARPQSAITDSQGNFEFSGLPAGGYRVFASAGQYSGGYLSISYGAKRPNGPGSSDPGTPIQLTEGQRFDKATIALPRGAVITGRVTVDTGEPLARVGVDTLLYAAGNARGIRTGGYAQTDDLGLFRLYGLFPGDYTVVAEAREPTYVQPNGPIEADDDRTGFMTTYFPGTADEASAQRVRTRLGAETPGIEIRMTSGRLFRISGFVTDSQGRASARTNGQLVKRTSTSSSSFGFTTDEQGRFQMRNIPPGTYRLVARGQQGPNAVGMNGPQGEQGEAASIPVTVNSDLEGIVLTTSTGASISGQIVFEQGPPQLPPGQQSFQMRVTAAIDPESNIGLNMPAPGLVSPDLTFTMRNLHGELMLRSSGPGMFLKSVSVGGRDITDTPYEFKNGDQVSVLMTTKASTLEGMVTDATGKPTPEATVLVFSDDKATWRMNSVRTRRGFVDATGKYRVTGLLSGRYYVVAVTRDRTGLLSNPDGGTFELLSKEATSFVVGDDEQRQVDLKVSPGGNG